MTPQAILELAVTALNLSVKLVALAKANGATDAELAAMDDKLTAAIEARKAEQG